MIIEHISKFNMTSLPNILQKGLEVLKTTDFGSMEVGEYEVEGRDLFYQIQDYSTMSRNEGQAELHKKYCDIQFIVSGKEAIGWATSHNQVDMSTYNMEKDIVFFPPTQDESLILMEKGVFVFFAPYEIHRPRLQWTEGKTVKVRKIVVKINAKKF